MKKNFLDVINNCKKQLRKHMKTGNADIIHEEDEMEEEPTVNNRRTIRRVDREAL